MQRERGALVRIALLGATGQTGSLVLQQALAAGDEIVALARTPGKLTVSHERLRVVAGDATRPDDIARALDGADAVLSVIGSRTLRPDTICTDSARAVLDAMRATGVRRFVCISGAGLNDNAGLLIQRMIRPTLLRNVFADAVAQDTLIRASDRDWTIVRPYRLTNGAGETAYQVSDAPFKSPVFIRWTRRADVADCMLHEVRQNRYVRHIAWVSTGAA